MSKPSFTIAVASRALFDLEDAHAVYEGQGLDAYLALQAENEDAHLEPGPAYGLVDGLARLNLGADLLVPPLNVVVVSRNDPASGMRFLNAVRAHGIGASRAVMTGGRPVAPVLASIGVDLFLTRSPEDGLAAARAGVPVGILAEGSPHVPFDGEVRIALDGDAVLFDDEGERLFEAGGYEGWLAHEEANRDVPLGEGPLAGFARKLTALRAAAHVTGVDVRLALVTARDGNARHRALRTLRGWGVRVDEAYCLGSVSKADALQAFRPHLFLDDRGSHVAAVASLAPSGLVPRLGEPVPAAEPVDEVAGSVSP